MAAVIDPLPHGDSPEVLLELENVSRVFGETEAVSQMSLRVHRGEILTLLGPSGCGKTTTLRMAIGLERINAGRIIFQGRVIDCFAERIFVPPEKRNMGMVFQSYAIWPHLTVRENVAYPLRARRRGAVEIHEKVRRALELVGLEGLEDRPGTKLSGGQQQRVAVARGLVFDPDLLLMDEPFSSLDAKLREGMRTELKLLQRRLGITILFVTHDQTEALALSDRLAVMDGGRMVQIGTPTELYTHPRTPAVRDFLGRTLLFNGQLLERNGTAQAAVRLDEGPVVRVAGAIRCDAERVGDRCVVALRPEQINVQPISDRMASSKENQLSAEIRALLFLGDRFEANVQLPSGAGATVYLSLAETWHEGQRVELQLAVDKLQLWDPEPAR